MDNFQAVQPMYFFGYVGYFKHLLENKMKESTFKRMIESREVPSVFRVKTDTIYQYKINDELETYMTLVEPLINKSSIIECLKKQYGTIAKIYNSDRSAQDKNEIDDFTNWMKINKKQGFLSNFKFSSLIPYIFLDTQSNDSILSCGCNFPEICEIVSDIINVGHLVINELDIKRAKSNYNFKKNNYCVISYPITDIPDIEMFDKVLCIAPSTEDGSIMNGSANKEFSLDQAIKNHEEQKKYLISSLEKVKQGGICVYATFSLNPFENEAVVNSVLKMKEFEDNFELVGCSDMYPDIKRKRAFDSWDLDYVPKNITNSELLESISSNSLIKNIDRCMRFYPHQIDCCGTFVAVIKKVKETNEQSIIPNQTNNLNDLKFTKAPNEIIQSIITEFKLPDICNDIHFVMKEDIDKKELYHLNTSLFGILNTFGFDKLNLCHVGSLGFKISNKKCDFPYIPSVQTLPSCAVIPETGFIKIDTDDFKVILNSGQISIDKLSMKNQIVISANRTGGVYLILENDHGALVGAYKNDEYLIVDEERDQLYKLYKVAKELTPQKSLKKKFNYILNDMEKNKNKYDEIEKKYECILNELKLSKFYSPMHLINEINISEAPSCVIFDDGFDFNRWIHYRLEFEFVETSIQGEQLRMQFGYRQNGEIIWDDNVNEYFYSTADIGHGFRCAAYTKTNNYFGFGNDDKFYRNDGGCIHGSIEFWNNGNKSHSVYARANTTSYRITNNLAATGGIYNFVYINNGSHVIDAFQIMTANGTITTGRFLFYGID